MATTAAHPGELADLCEHLAALKLLPRAGWLQRGVARPESVADHAYGVAALSLALGWLVEEQGRGRLLALAVVHDIGEALLTDLPLSAQRLLGRAAKQSAERGAVEAMLGGLPEGAGLVMLWEEYTAGATREARLVKALDRVELLSQALAYERAGSRALDEFWRGWDSGWDEFPELAALAAELHARRPAR
jgi:putative hydrolase of HD superfamily